MGHVLQSAMIVTNWALTLSPKVKFEWDETLIDAFDESKQLIVEAIKEDVKIYDITKKACLITDFSNTGIGYLLTQEHCPCQEKQKGCCKDDWPRI